MQNVLMASRMKSQAVRRVPLPLTESDERDLALIRQSSAYREALGALAGDWRLGQEGEVTESVLLHGVFAAGLDAIKALAQEAGYAQLAEERMTGEGERRRVARRRAPSWADDK